MLINNRHTTSQSLQTAPSTTITYHAVCSSSSSNSFSQYSHVLWSNIALVYTVMHVLLINSCFMLSKGMLHSILKQYIDILLLSILHIYTLYLNLSILYYAWWLDLGKCSNTLYLFIIYEYLFLVTYTYMYSLFCIWYVSVCLCLANICSCSCCLYS